LFYRFSFFVSCIGTVNNKNDLKEKIKDVFTLEEDEAGEKIFALDSVSVRLNLCVQLVDHLHDDSIYYTFFNEHNKSIYLCGDITEDGFGKVDSTNHFLTIWNTPTILSNITTDQLYMINIEMYIIELWNIHGKIIIIK
jgi:hypothetical protein